MTIDSFVSALQGKDPKALAACFGEDCHIIDYCPTLVGQPTNYAKGPHGIEMFYRNRFPFGGFSIQNAQIVDENTADFYATYYGKTVFAQATATPGADGSFKEVVIRPA